MAFYNCSYNGNSVTVQADNEDEARSKAHDDLHSGHGFLDLDAIEVYEADDEINKSSDAYNTGFEAYIQGEGRDANPYAAGTWDAKNWLAGFGAAE